MTLSATLHSHCAFAFEALQETLGEDCRLERLGPDSIVFMDRSDGSRYEINPARSALYCLRWDGSRACPPEDALAKKMRARLSPGYDRRRLALERAQAELAARAARAAPEPHAAQTPGGRL